MHTYQEYLEALTSTEVTLEKRGIGLRMSEALKLKPVSGPRCVPANIKIAECMSEGDDVGLAHRPETICDELYGYLLDGDVEHLQEALLLIDGLEEWLVDVKKACAPILNRKR